MQMIKILWSIHNSAWLLIWMDMLFILETRMESFLR